MNTLVIPANAGIQREPRERPGWIPAFAGMTLLLLSLAVPAQSLPDFGQLAERLHIRPEQQEQYDRAVGATKRAMLAVGLAAIEMKNALAAELARDRPDFHALAKKQNDLIDQQRPLFQEASREWQKLYKLMDPDQVTAAKAYLHENLGRFFQ